MDERQHRTVNTVPTRLGGLRVQQVGSGSPLVLWHSLFVDSASWSRLLVPLARDHRLVVIDGPSHGGSAPARRRFTLNECADSAQDVLEQLDVREPVDWLGNAWGGHVSILFAASRPDRCRSLVTIGTPVHAMNPAERRSARALVALYRATGPISPLTGLVATALLGRDMQRNDPEADRLVKDAFRHAQRRGMHTAMWSVMLTRPDLANAVRALTCPTLFVAGADDPIWTPAMARGAASHLSHGASATVPGGGHVAPLLETGPALLDLLAAFWKQPDATVARDGRASAQQ